MILKRTLYYHCITPSLIVHQSTGTCYQTMLPQVLILIFSSESYQILIPTTFCDFSSIFCDYYQCLFFESVYLCIMCTSFPVFTDLFVIYHNYFLLLVCVFFLALRIRVLRIYSQHQRIVSNKQINKSELLLTICVLLIGSNQFQ